MLPRLEPMIVGLGREAFDDDSYIFEPKWDGWRLLIYVGGNATGNATGTGTGSSKSRTIEAYTRKGKRVTHQFPELQEALGAIDAAEAVLDAEGICLRDGKPVFDDLAFRGRLGRQARIEQARWTHPATFVVFDILFLDGKSLLQEPLMSRKRLLAERVSSTQIMTPTMYVENTGKALFELTRQQNLEGMVAKRKDGLYMPGKLSPDWLKFKHWKSIDTVILGYRTVPRFALLVGLHFRTVRNKPVSTVELGITEEDRRYFAEWAAKHEIHKEGAVQRVEPKLCCRIGYQDRTDTHLLLSAVFQAFLPDKLPGECMWAYE